MPINDSFKLDLAYKKLGYGTQATSTTKAGYEDLIPSPVPTYSQDIWSEANLIPSPASELANISILSTDTLTLQSGSVTVFLSPHKDYIPFTFHNGYTVQVKDSSGVSKTLPPGSTNYYFDYGSGTLVFPEGAASYNGYTLPLKVVAYRYIGKKGVSDSLPSKAGNAGKVLTVNSSENGYEYKDLSYVGSRKQIVFQVGSDILLGIQEQTEIKLPFNCTVQNCEVIIGVDTPTLSSNLIVRLERYVFLQGIWQWSTLYMVDMGVTEKYKEDSSVTCDLLGDRLRINLTDGNYNNVRNMSVILNVALI
jgi:hypothetical protein